MAPRKRTAARVPGGRRARPTVLIVCEGETEYEYFKAVRRKFRAQWVIPKLSDESNPAGIMAYASREAKTLAKSGLDVETWLVFDAESEQAAMERSYKEVVRRALRGGMKVANSSPCFEYWPLIHYAPGANVTEPAQAVRELSRAGRVAGYRKPNLPFEELWDIYRTGAPSKAAQARRRDAEEAGDDPRLARPVTYVDELVDRLTSIAGER